MMELKPGEMEETDDNRTYLLNGRPIDPLLAAEIEKIRSTLSDGPHKQWIKFRSSNNEVEEVLISFKLHEVKIWRSEDTQWQLLEIKGQKASLNQNNQNVNNHVGKEKAVDDELYETPELIPINPAEEIRQKKTYPYDKNSKNTVESVEIRNASKDVQKTGWNYVNIQIDFLVFAISGMWKDGKNRNSVQGIKLLNRKIDGELGIGCRVLVRPINWEDDFQCEPGHRCPPLQRNFVKLENVLLENVRIYNCPVCGNSIRKTIITKLNEHFEHYRKNEKQFTVSLLGHSLGSVICYDILTMHSKELKWGATDKLFTVGSPLQYYLADRGIEAIKLFRDTVKTLKIHNIYHCNDPIANRLEPVLHHSHEKSHPMSEESLSKATAKQEGWWLPPPLNTWMKGDVEITENYHDIYWKHEGIYRYVALVFVREYRVKNKQKEKAALSSNSQSKFHDKPADNLEQKNTIIRNSPYGGELFRIETLETKPERSAAAVFINDKTISVSEIESLTDIESRPPDALSGKVNENIHSYGATLSSDVAKEGLTNQELYNVASVGLILVTVPITVLNLLKII